MESTVNERIIELKTYLNLGRNEFAAKANISPSTFDNIVSGSKPSPKTIKTISAALNVSTEWLLHGNGERFNQQTTNPNVSGWKEEAYKLVNEALGKAEADAKYWKDMYVNLVNTVMSGNLGKLRILNETGYYAKVMPLRKTGTSE